MRKVRCTTEATIERRNWGSTCPCGPFEERTLRPAIPWEEMELGCLSIAVFARPLMKEERVASRTCNDDGLCRMLYFSDD